MPADAQKKKGSRKKWILLSAGIVLPIIVRVAGAIGTPWIRWYIDGSNPGTPIATPIDGVETNAFDFETRTVLLNNGVEMPIYGIGTFNLTPEEAEESVYWALETGTRLIDTAHAYNNSVRHCAGGVVSVGRQIFTRCAGLAGMPCEIYVKSSKKLHGSLGQEEGALPGSAPATRHHALIGISNVEES